MNDEQVWPGEDGQQGAPGTGGPHQPQWPSAGAYSGGQPHGGQYYGNQPYGGAPGAPGAHGAPGQAPTGQPYAAGPAQPAGPAYPGMPIYPGGPAYGPFPGPSQPRAGRRAARASAAALLLVAAVVAGAGVSRLVWPTSTTPAASSPSTTYPGLGSGGSGGYFPGGTSGTSGTSGSSGGNTEGAGSPSDISAIAKEVDPAVVDINVVFNYEDAEGAGTGIVLTSNGEILTNNHVVDGATKISVTDVGNGKTYGATVVGYDSTHDVAVLQLQGASGLATAKLSTASPSVGEAVVAIGNAGGYGGTPTSAGGSVTALGKSISASDALDGTSEQLSGLLEVNANVEAGDSGGPLVNASGQVVGMDTAASEGFAFSASGNQGFAIPISEATSIAKDIKAGDGSSDIHVGSTAFLGVMVSTEAQGTTPGYGGSNVSGAQICDLSYCIVSGGPAQKAGIQVGDVITSLGGKAVTSATQLTHDLVLYHPGQTVKVSWVTPTGQSQSGDVKLASGPPA